MNGEVTVNANTATDKQLDEGQIAAENPRIEEGGLGVALSGGGVRATLFSLGALMYLVDSGYSQYVTDISSVSGGSITNAFVAQHIDFKTAHEHPGQFDEVAKKLGRILTEKGLLSTKYFIFAILSAGVLLTAVWWIWLWLKLAWWINIFLTFIILSALGIIFLLRGQVLSARLKRVLFTDGAGGATKLVGIKSQITHAFCATDLNSGKPFYFTNLSEGIMGNSEWGFWKAREDVELADVVRSSAAFPGAFSPKHLELSPKDQLPSLREAKQKALQELPPRAVFLADGGVWNNLGTSWFDDRSELLLGMDPKELPPWLTGNMRRELVINASANLKPLRSLPLLYIPFLAEVVGFFRFINVIYSSTLFPRITSLNAAFMLGATAKSTQEERETLSKIGVGWLPAMVQIDQDHWWQPLGRNWALLNCYQESTTLREMKARLHEPPPFDIRLKQQPDYSRFASCRC